jgi:proteasome lid subunit RPN8/RPN11
MSDPLAAVAAQLAALAEGSPEREVCGLVVRRPDGAVEVRPMENVAAHPEDGFELAPSALLRLLEELDGEGGELIAVFHSHPRGGAGLSQRDLDAMLCDGEPLLEGVAQVVIALSGGLAEEVRAHRWDGQTYAQTRLPHRVP